VTQRKCRICGRSEERCNYVNYVAQGGHDFDPEPPTEPKPARLTLQVTGQDLTPAWTSYVMLDGRRLPGFPMLVYQSASEAQAAAQAYIDELIEHFRQGGR